MTLNSPKRFFQQRYVPPFKHALPGNMLERVGRESPTQKRAANFMMLKRWFFLRLTGQSRLLSERLPPPPARLLWLTNPASASIGDSLMELSGRNLLGAYDVDLLTSKITAELYQTDRIFKKIFTDPEILNANRYDFVLLDLFNTASIKLKLRICPKLPFAGVQGYFYGNDYNRTLYSCYRIHHLLGYPHPEQELQPFLKPSLFIEDRPDPLPVKNRFRVSLVLGGVDPIRTYRLWPEVLRLLCQFWQPEIPFPEIVLIGSPNGQAYVEQAMTILGPNRAVSFVGTLSLRATVRLIAGSDFFIGTDGGLMHCALALNVPGLTLFVNIPGLRLPPITKMHTLYNGENVNDISPEIVAKRIREQICLASRP